MIGLDTNVLVRYIMQDDEAQSNLANNLMESLTLVQSGWVSIVTIIELTWVLDRSYHLTRTQITQALETLLHTRELQVDQAETVWRAIRKYRDSKADLADCLIERSAVANGCDKTVTFDRIAARDVGMCLLE